MITPKEEAVGRLQGLRQVVQGGNVKAARLLAEEIGSLAADRIEGSPFRDTLSEAADFLLEQLSGRKSAAKVKRVTDRIESTLTDLEQLLAQQDETSPKGESDGATLGMGAEEPPLDDGPQAINTGLLEVFLREAPEHLDSAEQQLLALEQDPNTPDALDAVFRGFHSVKGNAGFVGLSSIGAIAHEAETLFDVVRAGQCTFDDRVSDLAFRSIDALRGLVDALSSAEEPVDEISPQGTSLLAELKEAVKAVESGEELGPRPATPPPAETAQTPSDHPASETKGAPEATPNEQAGGAPDPGSQTRPSQGGSTSSGAGSVVRVDQRRLDDLVNLIGELVIAESIVAASCNKADQQGDTEQPLTQLNKITRELQQLSLSLRMVPIHDLFQKQFRLVRDLGRKLGKPVQIVTEGGGTELDKNVIDQLSDPLVHIVRNSVDHGVESPEERAAAGKPEQATLTLSAGYKGGSIRVCIRDDGRGLNRERILQKAIDRGVVPEDAELSGQEIDRLIFNPGLSTADTVTDVSGRGVGMDVVARNIEALRGSVEVYSDPGAGTEIAITLPITLAIVDGLVVRSGGNRYVIPSFAIEQLVEIDKHGWSQIAGRDQVLNVRGRNIAVFELCQLLGFGSHRKQPTEGVVVLAKSGTHALGLLVDDVVGRQQVVIKQLGDAIGHLPGLAGGAVMADGQVALIADVAALQQRLSGDRRLGAQ